MRALSHIFALGLLLAAATVGVAQEIDADRPARLPAHPHDYTRQELTALLRVVPRGTVFCGTGIRWYDFADRSNHTAKTVDTLLALFEAPPEARHRRLVAYALARQSRPQLRDLWLDLLYDDLTPTAWRPAVILGLGNTGSDRDLLDLTPRVIHDSRWAMTLLGVIERRELLDARSAALRIFRDRRLDAMLRRRGFTVACDLGTTTDFDLLDEGLADTEPLIRLEAVRCLAKLPPAQVNARFREALGDPSVPVRAAALRALGREVTFADVRFYSNFLRESDPRMRRAVGMVLGSLFRARPAWWAPPEYAQLFEMAEQATSPLRLSPGIMLELGRAAELRGQFSRALEFYALAAPHKKPPPFQSANLYAPPVVPPANSSSDATARFRLARLQYLLGRFPEAQREARRLRDDYPPGTRIFSVGYPLPYAGSLRPANQAGEEMISIISRLPLRLTIEAVETELAEGDDLRLRLDLKNVSGNAQIVSLYLTDKGELVPDPGPSLLLWGLSGSRPRLEGTPTEKTLRPGESVSAVIRAQTPFRPPRIGIPGAREPTPMHPVPFLIELIVKVRSRSEFGEVWAGRLRAAAQAIYLPAIAE